MRSLFTSLVLLWCGATLSLAQHYIDKNVYNPRKLAWSTPADVKKAERVFPHTLLPERAVLLTLDNILQTEDGGRTWKPWPDASRLGKIRAVAFDPMDSNRLLAAGDAGIWVSADNAETFQKFAGQENGLAAESVADLIFYGGDPGGNTILAVHGEATPGISRSRNSGKSWDIINPEYSFTRILSGDSTDFKRLYLIGASPSEPDVLGFFMSITSGEYVSEIMHDALLTDLAFDPAGRGSMIVATSDAGAFRVGGGGNALGQEVEKMPLEGVEGWASLSSTWGPNADVVELCGYDPAKAGLVLSGDEFKHITSFKSGVVVGPLVKQGAAVRPNANGTIFYAVANGTLSVGRAEGIPLVKPTPAALQLQQGGANFNDVKNAFNNFGKAADPKTGAAAEQLLATVGDLEAPYRTRQIVITAAVPGEPTKVLIDLSRLNGGKPDSEMYDDGNHNDGAAKDGVYGVSIVYDGMRQKDHDWRPSAPGRIPLGVSAVYKEGAREGTVALVGVYSKISSYDLWEKKGKGKIGFSTTGEVTVEQVSNPPDVRDGSSCLKIQTKGGPWSLSLHSPYNRKDITGYEAMSFHVRAGENGEAPDKLDVQFLDRPDLSEPVLTPKISAVPDLIEQGAIGTKYRQVIVPLDSLGSSDFQASRFDKVVISGEAKGPGEILIDGVRFHATRAELENP